MWDFIPQIHSHVTLLAVIYFSMLSKRHILPRHYIFERTCLNILKKKKKQKKSRTKWRPCDTRRSVSALETTGSYKEHPTAFTSPKIPCAAEIFPPSSSTSAPEHPPTPPCPISPGLSIWLSLLLIYYSSSPVSTCGRLLSRDHLMIDGSPEVTQGWGAKEMLGIQHTSWNSLMLP